MPDDVFVDTNVLVYNRDASEPAKQAQAHAWVEHLWRTRTGRLSYQVLQEYYVTVTEKLSPGLSAATAREEALALCAWQPIATDRRVMEWAWRIQDRYRLSWWDALIVSAAWRADCRYLLSEDLQTNQELGRLKVISPFSLAPAALE
jgi:predicted nucleic acid-binding protein